jgi:RNA polymerase sigma-70 factor, ECF subfamily
MKAFTLVVEKLSPIAWRIAFRILADNSTAEDVAQESLVRLWRNLGRIRNDKEFSAWFYRIVVNCCYDELRKRRRDIVGYADESTWQKLSEIIHGNNGWDFSAEEYSAIIKSLTSELSPVQRTVFVLSDLEGLHSTQVTEITGMNSNSVKANLHHARKRIKQLIKGRL